MTHIIYKICTYIFICTLHIFPYLASMMHLFSKHGRDVSYTCFLHMANLSRKHEFLYMRPFTWKACVPTQPTYVYVGTCMLSTYGRDSTHVSSPDREGTHVSSPDRDGTRVFSPGTHGTRFITWQRSRVIHLAHQRYSGASFDKKLFWTQYFGHHIWRSEHFYYQ